ncbi:MAG: ATP-dependent RNA helicase HrpA [Phycisphaerae bacterium]|nr:ATP-dependent RNA helicase HrpA [Phycisphaerae bacterium]
MGLIPFAPYAQGAGSAAPNLTLAPGLPITQHADTIAAHLKACGVVVVCGETGSGKSTQLPKLCWALGRQSAGMVGHTQPRRIAARSVATRVAEEVGVELGREVGWSVRFTDRTRAETKLRVMTDGILLAEAQRDRHFSRYDTIIVDEAHERSLNIDFLLGLLRRAREKRPDLRVIVTSATIDPERMARHFDDAPIVNVEGRTYPVEVRWRPRHEQDASLELESSVASAFDEIRREMPAGDVLTFLSGEREIRELTSYMRGHLQRHRLVDRWEILPLYGRLSVEDQAKVFASGNRRRIVLATNVAETSVTVPGVRAVIDLGTARISRFHTKTRVLRLPIEPISQASANQRSGRCGRVGPGLCLRLYDEQEFSHRRAFTDPEIRRTNLASVLLRMRAMRLGSVKDFPFLDTPKLSAVREAESSLREIGALRQDGKLTALGRRLSRLPVDPRLGRLILEGIQRDALREMLTLAAVLSLPDPRERSVEKRDEADAARRKWRRSSSDFLSLLALYEDWKQVKEDGTRGDVRRFCKEHHLHPLRMQEWTDLRRQLEQMATQALKATPNTIPATSESIHRCLLTAFLGNIGRLDKRGEYRGIREARFAIFPDSGLFKKDPKWIVAAEIVETSRRWGRLCAKVQPSWIEEAAGEHVVRSWDHPEWDAERGEMLARERGEYFGLELYGRRRVALAPRDPRLARELFIQHALVEEGLPGREDFLVANRELVLRLREMEARRRQRDLLAGDARRHAFYDRQIPDHVVGTRSFRKWFRKAHKRNPELLRMTEADALRDEDAGERLRRIAAEETAFPSAFLTGAGPAKVRYTFQPGDEMDGVRLQLLPEQVAVLDEDRPDWLVPGRLAERIEALCRTLPRDVRRGLMPLAEQAQEIARELSFGRGNLLVALGEACRSRGVPVRVNQFQPDQVPDDLKMLLEVVDDQGEVIARSRDLADLRKRLGERIAEASVALADAFEGQAGLRHWAVGSVGEVIRTVRGGVLVEAWSALVPEVSGTTVAYQLVFSEDAADAATRASCARFLAIDLAEDLDRQLPLLPGSEVLDHLDDATRTIVREAIVALAGLQNIPTPHSAEALQSRFDPAWRGLWKAAEEVLSSLQQHRSLAGQVAARLVDFDRAIWDEVRDDLRRQYLRALPKLDWSPHQLNRSNTRLRGLLLRMERLKSPQGIARDLVVQKEINAHRRTVDALREKAGEPWSAGWRALDHLHNLVEDLAAARFMVGERAAPAVHPDHLAEALRRAEHTSGS